MEATNSSRKNPGILDMENSCPSTTHMASISSSLCHHHLWHHFCLIRGKINNTTNKSVCPIEPRVLVSQSHVNGSTSMVAAAPTHGDIRCSIHSQGGLTRCHMWDIHQKYCNHVACSGTCQHPVDEKNTSVGNELEEEFGSEPWKYQDHFVSNKCSPQKRMIEILNMTKYVAGFATLIMNHRQITML